MHEGKRGHKKKEKEDDLAEIEGDLLKEIKELMRAGARLDEAEEVVLPKWILLPPEEPDPEEPDWETTELADREAAYQRLQASIAKAEKDANLLFPE